MLNPLSNVRGKRLRNQMMTPIFWVFALSFLLLLIAEVITTLRSGNPSQWGRFPTMLLGILVVQTVVALLTALNWLCIGHVVAVLTDDCLHVRDAAIPWAEISGIEYDLLAPCEDMEHGFRIGTRLRNRRRFGLAHIYTTDGEEYSVPKAPYRLLTESKKRASHIRIGLTPRTCRSLPFLLILYGAVALYVLISSIT